MENEPIINDLKTASFLDSTVCSMVRVGAPLDDMVVQLVREKMVLIKRLMAVEAIAPKRIKTSAGDFVFHIPDSLVPVTTDLTKPK